MKPTTNSTNANQLAWWAREAVVYFIAAGAPAVAIKIGVTGLRSVRSRLGALQSANHEPIELLGVLAFRDLPLPMKRAEDLERELHERFRRLQRAPEGTRGYEWFTAAPELIEFIAQRTVRPESLGLPRCARAAAGGQETRASSRM